MKFSWVREAFCPPIQINQIAWQTRFVIPGNGVRKSRRKRTTRNVISFYIKNHFFRESVCKTKICRRGKFRVQKTRRVPRVRGRGLRRANLRGARFFFFDSLGTGSERFWLNNCSGCIQQMYNRGSAEKLTQAIAKPCKTKPSRPAQGKGDKAQANRISFPLRCGGRLKARRRTLIKLLSEF